MTISIGASDSELQFPTITDEALEALRRLIGVPIADTVEPWCYEATRDNIRHYAHGIGDDNPLWCDPATRRRPLRHRRRPAVVRVRPEPDPVGLRRRAARHPRHVGGRRPHLAPADPAGRRRSGRDGLT